MSNLKKCMSDEPLAISLDEVHIDDKLCFIEEPVEVMDREVKRLKQSRIPIIKVQWNSRRDPEFTWEREDQFRKKDVPNDAIKLMLFSYSLEGAARIWYEKEPPNSILTWHDLAPNNHVQPGILNELSSYMKSNETLIRNMQNQINVLRGDFNKQDENLRRNLNNDMRSILGCLFQNQASTLGTLPSNTVPNPKGEMKVVTSRSGLAYEGPSIPTNSPLEKVVERDTEETTDKEHSNCQGSTAHIQPPKLHEKATNQMEKFFQIFHDFQIDISFADAVLLMPKFASTIKSLLTNKDKLFELEKVPLNENCSAMLLKKLLEKLGDPGKFLIPCDFLGTDKKLSLPKLTPTRMTLELADRSIARPKGAAEDVFLKVGKFHFPTDFVVVDFEADPRVPLILGRSFLRTGCALIDVYGEETLRVNDESVTFNLNQTMRYSSTYDDNSVNRVDVINIACEEFVQDVLDFQYNSKSSNLTLVSNPSFSEETNSEFCKEPIVKSSSPTLTPFGESNFFLKEIEDFLKDESIPMGIEDSFYDPEGDILYLEKLLNDDPFQLPPMDLKQAKETKAKYSIEEPPELELKELPSHLEYAFLEDTDKLPVIIAKDLKDVEKEALIKVLKSHKSAIAWKISNIKGFDPRFCIHKILMEEDYKPTVQSQRRKLNDATRKDHFTLPFMDQMLERLAGNEFYCFLDGFSGYFQISIDPQDQEKTTFTCPYGNFAYRRMPFGLCNAPGHKVSKSGIEIDRVKVNVIAKLPHSTTVKGVRSFLGHTGFYRRFIQDFSKIARPMTHLLEKETPFVFSKDFVNAFETLKKKLTEAPILIVPDWNLPFKLMCDANDFAISAYMLLKSFGHTLSKSIVYTDHSALKYLLSKQDAKPRLLWSVLLLQEFDITIRDKKGSENLAAHHLSRLENPHKDVLENKDINENFPLKTLGSLSSGSTSWAIISDRGTHFYNDQFARVMTKYGVTHRFATAYHPQTSGQVEVSNRGLKRTLERTIGENRVSWSDKLDDALWAFRTAFKTQIGCTPYKLVYRNSCHLPIELEHKAYWALKHVNFNLKTAGDHRKLQLNELNELRDQAYENSLIYKERTKKLYDFKIKNRIFNVGDQVLLFNSRLKIFSGKLKTRWLGPFTITQVFPYGTVELSQPNGPNLNVNGHRVKHYFGGDIPSKVVLDLHTIPMDK
nr:reverse transcriptase domain-containing protein [Tanacetum cinerariifolium]